jgi:hypothetical protein
MGKTPFAVQLNSDNNNNNNNNNNNEARGRAEVKALCYSPEGRGFEAYEVDFSIYHILPAALGPVIYSASNRNEYQKQRNNVSGDGG